MKTLILMVVLFSIGCAYSIKDVDTSGTDPKCLQTCTTSYSSCVSGGPSVGFKTETLRACRESYEVCVKSCRN